MEFQSTFPRGERRIPAAGEPGNNNFNPRSRVGNDAHVAAGEGAGHGISIHVPAWGTTKAWIEDQRGYAISIHVPAWGTTKE